MELEEEKKTLAEWEKRVHEQAKKIENLSSMVLFSNRDETRDHIKKVFLMHEHVIFKFQVYFHHGIKDLPPLYQIVRSNLAVFGYTQQTEHIYKLLCLQKYLFIFLVIC